MQIRAQAQLDQQQQATDAQLEHAKASHSAQLAQMKFDRQPRQLRN